MESNKEFFKKILSSVEREGVQELINYLEDSDFYEAPCSTRFHNSFKGGLCGHSINVFMELRDLISYYDLTDTIPKDSVIIVGLLHDLCKVNTYVETEVNIPPQRSSSGKWEKGIGFIKSEDTRLGHGAKSLSTIQDYIKLTDQEKEAIYWHMGAYDISSYSSTNDLCRVYENNKLAFLLHTADEIATFIIETGNK